jgi:hypothetical protein
MAILSDIIQRGSIGSRPTPTTGTSEGILYFDTTNSILYRWSGSSWESIEGSGSSGRTPSYDPRGTLDRTYTFASTTESWVTASGTLAQAGGRLTYGGSTAEKHALEPAGLTLPDSYEAVWELVMTSGNDLGVIVDGVGAGTSATGGIMLAIRRSDSGEVYHLQAYNIASGYVSNYAAIAAPNTYAFPGATVRLMVRREDDAGTGCYEIYLNDTYMLSFRATGLASGRLGVRAYNGTIECDSLTVYEL